MAERGLGIPWCLLHSNSRTISSLEGSVLSQHTQKHSEDCLREKGDHHYMPWGDATKRDASLRLVLEHDLRRKAVTVHDTALVALAFQSTAEKLPGIECTREERREQSYRFEKLRKGRT